MYFRRMGSGKPIVFLHGWGCDGSVFLPVANLLPNYKCFLLDFNGFGNSPPPPKSGWTVENYAYCLENFFRVHNLKKVCIVAHSFGCRVAMVFAAQNPELVERLVLVAPAGLRNFSLLRWFKVKSYKCQRFLHNKGLIKVGAEHFGSEDYRACSDVLKNTFVKVINKDLSAYAKRVKCPTLIISGKADDQTPLKQAKKLQRLIKKSGLVEIEGGHFALFTTPKAFAQTVRYFCSEEC